MSVVHVACAADGAYVPHSAAMLHSLLAHRGRSAIHVHYLHGEELPGDAGRRLTEMVESLGGRLSLHEIADERIAGLPSWEYITTAAWFRIFLPELLPEVDRVLYLDVDTIVLDSVEPLWETDLGDNYVGAVTNVFELDQLDHAAELGLAGPESYFNSGVLLMNLSLMRRDNCADALREFSLSRGAAELSWFDQDALNVVVGSRRLALHPRWNCMNSVLHFPWGSEVFGAEAVEEARRRPAIRHFEGPADNKPWHYLCRWDMREAYFYHRQQTPWPSLELEGVTLRNALKRLVRPLRRGASRTAAVGVQRPS